MSEAVIAESIKDAYSDLYAAHEYAHELSKDEISSKLKTLTGAAAEDGVIPYVAGTFTSLSKLANFEATRDQPRKKSELNCNTPMIHCQVVRGMVAYRPDWESLTRSI